MTNYREVIMANPALIVPKLVVARGVLAGFGESWPPPQARTVLRQVTVRDRSLEPWWARRLSRPRAVATVLTQHECQHEGCGAPRGEPHWNGPVQEWTNPCGHLDLPEHMIIESWLVEIAYVEQRYPGRTPATDAIPAEPESSSRLAPFQRPDLGRG
ncbi:hypothetical protein [Nocardia altamirensis]|uniref:hypothetical protein n=1 Tax=Nocardia altamirensis TaxID=472158 RepID=UPI0008405866|nr:hypothetical protein [Nocardia altamirensis]